MRRGLWKALPKALLFALAACSAAATPVDCGLGVSDVTSLGSEGCIVGNLTFRDFDVNTVGNLTSTVVGIANGSLGTGISGNVVNLVFQFNPGFAGAAETGDLLLSYEVVGGIGGVDNSFQATPETNGGNVVITEIVCDQPFTGPACLGKTLANYQSTSLGAAAYNSALFPWTDPAFIKKDISFNNATMSEFTNGQLVPEPMTLSLIGIGLLGMGMFGPKRHSSHPAEAVRVGRGAVGKMLRCSVLPELLHGARFRLDHDR